MNKKLFFLFTTALMLVFASCEDLFNKEDSEKDTLYVKFINDQSSEYSISKIEIRNRGVVDSGTASSNDWSPNLLKNGLKLNPGEFAFFTLDIPSGEWAEYRLGVDNGSGTEIMIYDQIGYDGFTDLPITHWGGDDRTVTVTIKQDQYSGIIKVTGWSDWVGIDE